MGGKRKKVCLRWHKRNTNRYAHPLLYQISLLENVMHKISFLKVTHAIFSPSWFERCAALKRERGKDRAQYCMRGNGECGRKTEEGDYLKGLTDFVGSVRVNYLPTHFQ
jgi:hypothetical protein